MTEVLQAQVPLLAIDGGTSQYFQEVFNLLVECCDANTASIAALTLRVAAAEATIADHELRIAALEP